MTRLAHVLSTFLAAMTRAMAAEDIPSETITRVRNRIIYGSPHGPRTMIRLDQLGEVDSVETNHGT